MAAGLLALPCIARGQGKTWVGTGISQMVEAAGWRLGDLRINASLSLTNVGYDTDVYYGYLDKAVPDATFSASVPIQVLLPLGKKVLLELTDHPQYTFYLETEKERAWSNIFGGRAHLTLKRVYFQAGGEVLNARRRMSPELDVNIREKSDRLEGTVLWQASESLSLASLYEYARYRYDDSGFEGISLAETQNREEHFVDLVTYVQPSARIRLHFDGQYGRYIFTEIVSRERDARSYGVFGGLDFVPREREAGEVEPPRGSISLGYKRFDIVNAAFADGSGFVGAIDISAGLFEKTTARAAFSRDFEFSVYSDGTFYLSTALGGGISRQLSRKASFSYDVSFGWSAYPEDGLAGSPDARNFHYSSHTASLNIRLARHMGITFYTTLGSRVVGDAGSRRTRNFFGLNLFYGFPSGSIAAPVGGISR